MQRKVFAVQHTMPSLYTYMYNISGYRYICSSFFYVFERKVRAESDISRVLQVPINGIWFLKIFVTILVSVYAAPT